MENEPSLVARVGDAITPTVGDLTGAMTTGALWWVSGFADHDVLNDAYAYISTWSPIDPELTLSARLTGVGPHALHHELDRSPRVLITPLDTDQGTRHRRARSTRPRVR